MRLSELMLLIPSVSRSTFERDMTALMSDGVVLRQDGKAGTPGHFYRLAEPDGRATD